MSFRVREEKLDGDVLETVVEYTLRDGTKMVVSVFHPDANDRAAVGKGIQNRELTEQARADAEDALAEWIDGSGQSIEAFHAFPMKIRVVGDTVETSHGNSVPLSDSIAFYNAWISGDAEAGRKIGDFEIKTISPFMSVIDCSSLSFEEIERVIGPLADS